MHKHKPHHRSDPLPYFREVATSVDDTNRSAHGGIRYIERCSCGAKREVLHNGPHAEHGPWRNA